MLLLASQFSTVPSLDDNEHPRVSGLAQSLFAMERPPSRTVQGCKTPTLNRSAHPHCPRLGAWPLCTHQRIRLCLRYATRHWRDCRGRHHSAFPRRRGEGGLLRLSSRRVSCTSTQDDGAM